MNQGISERRTKLGITQKALSVRAGVAQSAVSDAENGNRVSARKVARILEALDAMEREASGIPDARAVNADSAGHSEPAFSMPVAMSAPLRSVPTGHHPHPHTPPADWPELSADAERALAGAFDASRHTLYDLRAVARLAPELPTDELAPEARAGFFRSALEAAARLRVASREVTAGALAVEMMRRA